MAEVVDPASIASQVIVSSSAEKDVITARLLWKACPDLFIQTLSPIRNPDSFHPGFPEEIAMVTVLPIDVPA